jgi:glycosyltransferase involved in cell wall biosynthesis
MLKDLISVIVPIYNIPEKLLRKCIESITNQTYKNLEIILINDCSPDNSRSVISHYAELDSRIIFIDNNENKGISSSRNNGLRIMTGDFFTFVDADDYIDPNRIALLLEEAIRTKAEIVVSAFKYVTEEERFLYYERKKNQTFNLTQIHEKVRALPYLHYYVWSKLFKTETFKEIRFNPKAGRSSEDSIYSIECFVKASTMAISSDTSYNYVYRPNSITNSVINWRYIMSEVEACKQIENIFTTNGCKDIYTGHYWKPVYQKTTLLSGKISRISDREARASLFAFLREKYYSELVHVVPVNRYHPFYRFLFTLNSPGFLYYCTYFIYRSPINLITSRITTFLNVQKKKN